MKTETTVHYQPEYGDPVVDPYGTRKGRVVTAYSRHCSNCQAYMTVQFDSVIESEGEGDYHGELSCPNLCDITWDLEKKAWVFNRE